MKSQPKLIDPKLNNLSYEQMVFGIPFRARKSIKYFKKKRNNIAEIDVVIDKCLRKKMAPKRIVKLLIRVGLVDEYDQHISKRIYRVKYYHGIDLSPRLTKLREGLRDALSKKLTKAEIVEKFDFESEVHAERTINRFGLNLKDQKIKEARKKIIEMHLKGISRKDIAQAVDRSPSSVSKVIQQYNNGGFD